MLIEGFRGWGHLDARPGSHVLVAGVPRAGRTDLITALALVLDPDAARGAVLSDLHQRPVVLDGAGSAPAEAVGDVAEGQAEAVAEVPAADAVGAEGATGEDASGDNGSTGQPSAAVLQRVEAAQVEVTLTDFDPDVQQLLDGVLEPLEDTGCASEDPDASAAAPLCARLAYRLSYDAEAETLESVVYFPARSNPALGQYSRVPAATRRMLPVVTLDAGQPLQLRAGAGLRRILDERDAKAGAAAFDALAQAVAEAVSALSADPAVAEAVNAVLAVGGTGERIGDAPLTAEQVGFRAEDGSVAALLRTLRAALHLDAGGMLGLAQHGSTVSAVLSMAEAMLLATVPSDRVYAQHYAQASREGSATAVSSPNRVPVLRGLSPPQSQRAGSPGRGSYSARPPGPNCPSSVRRETPSSISSALQPVMSSSTVQRPAGPRRFLLRRLSAVKFPPGSESPHQHLGPVGIRGPEGRRHRHRLVQEGQSLPRQLPHQRRGAGLHQDVRQLRPVHLRLDLRQQAVDPQPFDAAHHPPVGAEQLDLRPQNHVLIHRSPFVPSPPGPPRHATRQHSERVGSRERMPTRTSESG
ncbi:hypothetical protein [Streptomyces cyaneofuscatus]|uniref:hypothetical protein n=1 Tax=Streptomyces cyaneofuscatus TaxID=66883 RepID=UPI003F531486